MSDHYKVLNVSRNATTDEIKKSYRKLAVIWHPDKNPDNQNEATEKFRAIAEAYEILSDPDQRQQYDRVGVSCNNFESNSRPAPRGSNGHNFSESRAFDIFNAFFAEFDDFHQQAFSGFGGFPQTTRGGQRAQFGGGIPRGFGMQNSLFDDPFFSGHGGGDPFARANMNMNMGGGFGMHQQMHNMMLGGGGGALSGFGGMGGMGMVSSSSSSYSSSSGMNGVGRSVSTTTSIGQDGRKVTKKITTVTHPGGRKETSVEEHVEEPPGGSRNNRLAYGGGSMQNSSGGGGGRIGSTHNTAIDLTSSNGSGRSNVGHYASSNGGATGYVGNVRRK